MLNLDLGLNSFRSTGGSSHCILPSDYFAHNNNRRIRLPLFSNHWVTQSS